MSKLDLKDGGYRSRKFWFAIWSTALICAMALLAEKRPVLAGLFPVLVGGIGSVVAAYFAVNVGSKYVTAKAAASGQNEPAPPGQPPEGGGEESPS